MKYIVDRLEGNFAVCEDEEKKMHNISLDELPKGVKEGMALCYKNGCYTVSEVAESKKNRLQEKMNRLWK